MPFARSLKIGLVVLLSGLAGAAPRADNYPVRPIRIIIPFSPGGPNDLIGRPLAEKMSESLGQPFVIENRPGAQGQIAALAVARSTPDGYTMLMTTGSHIANQVFYARLQYDALRDFAPITQLAQSYGSVMVSRPGLEAKTASDLITPRQAEPRQVQLWAPRSRQCQSHCGRAFPEDRRRAAARSPL